MNIRKKKRKYNITFSQLFFHFLLTFDFKCVQKKYRSEDWFGHVTYPGHGLKWSKELNFKQSAEKLDKECVEWTLWYFWASCIFGSRFFILHNFFIHSWSTLLIQRCWILPISYFYSNNLISNYLCNFINVLKVLNDHWTMKITFISRNNLQLYLCSGHFKYTICHEIFTLQSCYTSLVSKFHNFSRFSRSNFEKIPGILFKKTQSRFILTHSITVKTTF